MFDCTRRQIELLKRYQLPATWALQYDALIQPRYQKLLKEQLGTNDEIAAWWEIPQPLAEKAGLKWRGQHTWDPAANVGFSPGYTPDERRRLVDVYMADFKAVFGRYPQSVGSWFLDEVTLAYLAERYGIVASCNCKDQIGTDGYTLWGGYWNQAYYPSRVNAYMPAQTRAGQIPVPIFRMLGSDPIYQHGKTPGLISLEPVYKQGGGGMPKWVDWFLKSLVEEPALAFGYTQAGQENSFGWEAMREGLNYQIPRLAELAQAGRIRIETLAESGKWFRRNFPVTPATAVVARDDWKDQGHKTVWYQSRFYRLNVLWEKNAFWVRDVHAFAENIVSPTHETPLKETSLSYETLPVVDWAQWSAHRQNKQVGLFPVSLADNGATVPLRPEGQPAITESGPRELRITQALQGGGILTLTCAEELVLCSGTDGNGKPLNWAWTLVGGDGLKALIRQVNPTSVSYRHAGTDYELKLAPGSGTCRQLPDGSIQFLPNPAGVLGLKLDTASVAALEHKQAARPDAQK